MSLPTLTATKSPRAGSRRMPHSNALAMSFTWISGRHGVPSLRMVMFLEVTAQPVAHSARGRESQAGDAEVLVRELLQLGLGADLGLRVRGQRIERRGLLARRVVGHAVHAAARRENEGAHARG